jgi:O-antigen ligase
MPTAAPALALPLAAEASSVLKSKAVCIVYCALLLMIPVETVSTLGSPGSSLTFVKLLGPLLFALAIANREECFGMLPLSFWLFGAYFGACALSELFLNPGPVDGLFRENQATMAQMLVLYLISANVLSDPEFRRTALRLYGWWVSIVAAAMLLGSFDRGRFVDLEGRSTILGQDPNVAAGFFTLGALALAGDIRLLDGRRFLSGALSRLPAVAVLFLAIIETGSRGCLLALGAGILGLAACGTRGTRARRAVLGAAVVATLAVLVVRQFQQGTTAAARLTRTWTEGDTAGRDVIYDDAWAMFRERPLLGYGATNNFAALGKRLNFSVAGVFYRDTHNLLLAVLTEVGMIGALPFVAAFLGLIAISWRYGRRSGDGVPFAFMCAELAMNASITGYHQKLFWIALACAAACGLELKAARRRLAP